MDGAINAVRAVLAQGLSWPEVERLIKVLCFVAARHTAQP